MEDPEIIRLNIRRYQNLLKHESAPATRERIEKLLAEAQAQLPLAIAEAAERKR